MFATSFFFFFCHFLTETVKKKIYMQFPSFCFLTAVSQETVYPGEVLELQDSRAAIPLDLQGALRPEYGLLILYAMNAM